MRKGRTVLVVLKCDSGFTYQGPRFISLGPNSGEFFKQDFLIPYLNRLDKDDCGVIDFEGTRVYSPSFLEESFGGAVRDGYADKVKALEFKNIPDEWRRKLVSYINNAVSQDRK